MEQKKPNILWIISDQHRAQALGINGDPNFLLGARGRGRKCFSVSSAGV